jgi:hypothetical protein
MNTMRNYLAFWVAGLLAGMILMERWHRSADGPEPSNSEAIQSHGDASPTVKPKAPMDVSNLVNLVVTGAKLDVQSVRRRVTQAR